VIQQYCADKEAPHEHLPAICSESRKCILEPDAEEEAPYSQNDWRNDVVFLKHPQLRELEQILYEFKARLKKL
jgi:hypothetical protein